MLDFMRVLQIQVAQLPILHVRFLIFITTLMTPIIALRCTVPLYLARIT
jgi:hypothetical protein